MRSVVVLVLLISIVSVGFSKPDDELNLEVVEMLKFQKFNLEFYELSFCIDEILNIVENDSSYCEVWDARISSGFVRTLEDEIIYVHLKELDFFETNLLSDKTYKTKYPFAFKYILNSLEINIDVKKGVSNFHKILNVYVKYPEQIDDICLISLICNFDCMVFNDIQNDDISNWKFNNWLKYGFDEFRYFPSTQDSANIILTNRISNHIVKSSKCKTEPLVIKSIKMIQAVMNKYK